MKEVTAVGIDLAKSVFVLNGVNKYEKSVLKKKIKRKQLLKFVAQLPKCRIFMEACGSAHYWAREFKDCGHEVGLMAGKYVKKFVQNNKDDEIDAEAIVTAGLRPNTRFIPVKTPKQLEVQALHRVRSRLVNERTAKVNEMRGFLYEQGFVIAKGIRKARAEIKELLETDDLSSLLHEIIQDLYSQYIDLDERVKEYETRIKREHATDENFERLTKIPGVGLLTASAIIQDIDPSIFKNGRQFAAYYGLVPRHKGTGGRNVNYSISKRGDAYIRTLLIHGARSVLRFTGKREDDFAKWCENLKRRKGTNLTSVAVANKNARMIWKILTTNCEFELDKAAA